MHGSSEADCILGTWTRGIGKKSSGSSERERMAGEEVDLYLGEATGGLNREISLV